jgi:serine/threonine protein phosphatase PrpC
MNWAIAKTDHIGGRSKQQDRVTTFSAPNGKIHLLVIADGMGGHKGGSLAAQMVIESAKTLWEESQQGFMVKTPQEFLQRICEKTHHEINQLGKKYDISPRSTCVLLYIHYRQAWWAHVGDSRLYHFRGQKLLYRSRDHSVVQLLADLGRIKEEEMATHPDQNRLFKGLGGNEPVTPDFGQAEVRPGDTLILCSDGFWEHVSPLIISGKLMQTDMPLKKQINSLLQEALDAGGSKGDNIAIAAAQLSGSDQQTFLNKRAYVVLLIIGLTCLTGGVWHYLKLRLTKPLYVETLSSNPSKNNTSVATTMPVLSNTDNTTNHE